MCLISVAIDTPGPWLLVVAANRDEFHDRHAAAAAYWNGTPQSIFAGRDLQGGGTWLGMRRADGDRGLRIGALTNLRPGLMPPPEVPAPAGVVPPSRGGLVAGYLAGRLEPSAFLETLDPPADAYAGFNFLAMQVPAAANGVDACYLNNLPRSSPRRLLPGVHVVSNATLDVEWPKTRRLRDAMVRALDAEADRNAAGDESRFEGLEKRLFEALADRTTAPAASMPRTGLEPERERLLSAPFIVDDHYGTRCSTVIAISRAGSLFFTERRFGPGGCAIGTVRESTALS